MLNLHSCSTMSMVRSIFVITQFRGTVRSFCDKELAPFADEIDKTNDFPQLRVSSHVHVGAMYKLICMYTIRACSIIINNHLS